MELSESYRRRLNELAGIDVLDFKNFSKEEYEKQLKKLGIEKFSDLIGRTVYNIKPVYGEHKVLNWFPDRGEYLLFTGGQRVLANPFTLTVVPEKSDKETESELKWVIDRLSSEDVESINILDKKVDENGSLFVTFDLITRDYKTMYTSNKRIDVRVLYSSVVLRLSTDKHGIHSYLQKEGKQEILESSDGEGIGHKWEHHAPFLDNKYETTKVDRDYMKKIVERIILEML